MSESVSNGQTLGGTLGFLMESIADALIGMSEPMIDQICGEIRRKAIHKNRRNRRSGRDGEASSSSTKSGGGAKTEANKKKATTVAKAAVEQPKPLVGFEVAIGLGKETLAQARRLTAYTQRTRVENIPDSDVLGIASTLGAYNKLSTFLRKVYQDHAIRGEDFVVFCKRIRAMDEFNKLKSLAGNVKNLVSRYHELVEKAERDYAKTRSSTGKASSKEEETERDPAIDQAFANFRKEMQLSEAKTTGLGGFGNASWGTVTDQTKWADQEGLEDDEA